MTVLARPTATRRALRAPGGRGGLVAALAVAWLLVLAVLHGRATLALAPADLTPLHRRLNDLNDAVSASRSSNPLFTLLLDPVRVAVDALVAGAQALLSQPALGLPIPVVGWLGVVALAAVIAWWVGGVRVGVLALVGFVYLGLTGLWQESMDTLALTLSAVVVSLLVGIPLGIWAGVSDRVHRVVTPVLDFMQTMPTFVYLAPLTLVFLIGPASATIATMIYAVPPAVRLTDHGIRRVPAAVQEATTSLGATRRQALLAVLVPMAKRTIVLGANQTIMSALSMVTIAALIDAPGLGQTVVKALETLDVGTAFNAGLAIVVLAIVLDRTTTAASERTERERRASGPGGAAAGRARRVVALGLGALALVCVHLSRTYVWAAEFPASAGGLSLDLGSPVARAASAVTTAVSDHASGLTGAVKDAVTSGMLDPLQDALAQSPWWSVGALLVLLALLLAGARTAVVALCCVALLVATGVWSDAMVTLAATLVATAIVMVLGLAVGVWMGRSARVDAVVRPVLDAAQTMPAFVYLVPFVALFAASRFTAVAAAVVFAAPVAIKIIADGIRGVPAATVEAARSTGTSTAQLVAKVQLPLAAQAVALAANQGLIYVLSMVVVGGLVGGGALGYDVVAGFSQDDLYGKGLAAGLAIVLLGVLLDRTTQGAAQRLGRAPAPRA